MPGPTDRTDELRDALAGAGAIVAYLFGSRALGTQVARSDADVAILVDGDVGLLEREALADQLAAILDVDEVDVVILNRAPLELRGRVVQEGRLLFVADQSRRVDFEVRTRSQYLDFLPTLAEHTRRYLQKVADKGL